MSGRTTKLAWVVLTIIIVIGIWVFCGSSSNSNLSTQTSTLPQDEINFLTTTKYWSDKYDADRENGLTQSNDIIARRNTLCPILNGGAFQNWVATFIRIDDDFNSITMRVGFGNGVSFTADIRMADQTVLSTFQAGQKIIISGSFVPSTDTCFSTTALSNDGAMINPDFSVTITSAQAMN